MGNEQDLPLERLVLQEAFLTGVSSVDEEHRFLIGIYNSFVDAINSGHGAEVVGEVMAELVAYTDYHFANEEQIMEKVRYPEFVIHKSQHDNFISAIADIEEKRSHGEVSLVSVAQFIGRWVQGHILITDKKLGEFVQSQPPKP